MNDIDIFENVFDPSFCKELYDDSTKNFKSNKDQWTTNYMWMDSIIKASHTVLVRSYDEDYKNKILYYLMERELITNKNYFVMNYMWTKLSYIPWHKDSVYSKAITIYLNPTWEDDWGGIFLYKLNESKHLNGYIPTFNTAVRNNSNINHSVSPVSLDVPYPRSTIQIFPEK